MSDPDRTPSERKALRSVAILKLTGRNEGEPRKTLGEAIYAVFADCCEAGSAGDLEETDPVVLSALDGWLNLDIALDELPTGTRDELCVQAFTQALEDIEKLHAQVRARLSVQQIQLCSTSFHLHMRDRHLHATRPVGQKDSEHQL